MKPVMQPATSASLVIGMFAMSFAAPAFATRQCPPEFGEKSSAFMMVGWSLLFLALVLGMALLYFVIKRTRGWKLWHRIPVLLLGGIGMLAVWFVGLGVFVGGFALAC